MTIFQEAILPPGCVRQRNGHCLHFLSKSFWWSTCSLISTYLWSSLEIWKITVESQEYKIQGPQNPNKITGKDLKGSVEHCLEFMKMKSITELQWYGYTTLQIWYRNLFHLQCPENAKPALVTTSHKVHKLWGEDK